MVQFISLYHPTTERTFPICCSANHTGYAFTFWSQNSDPETAVTHLFIYYKAVHNFITH